jgi:hypothetical protein
MLVNNFNIFRDYIIPKGKYNWWQNEIKLTTKGARNIWGEATYGFGDFYNGKRNDVKLLINWKVAVPFFAGATIIRNNMNCQKEISQPIFTSSMQISFSARK